MDKFNFITQSARKVVKVKFHVQKFMSLNPENRERERERERKYREIKSGSRLCVSVSLMNSADGPECSRNMCKFPSCRKIYNTS